MPYIQPEQRKLYEKEIQNLVDKLITVFSTEPTKISANRAGHLNYIITTVLKNFYENLQKKLLNNPQLKYSDHNEIIGMLECCKQEWYRRQAGPYEDLKIEENGDV